MNEAAKKALLRSFPYGLFIMGLREAQVEDPETDLYAVLGSWFSQVSFRPPLVALGIRKDTRSLRMIEESRVLTINALRKDQKAIAMGILKGSPVDPEAHTIAGLAYEPGEVTEAPVLPELAGSLELEVRAVHDDGGDHAIVVAEVVGAHVHEDFSILLDDDVGVTYGG